MTLESWVWNVYRMQHWELRWTKFKFAKITRKNNGKNIYLLNLHYIIMSYTLVWLLKLYTCKHSTRFALNSTASNNNNILQQSCKLQIVNKKNQKLRSRILNPVFAIEGVLSNKLEHWNLQNYKWFSSL